MTAQVLAEFQDPRPEPISQEAVNALRDEAFRGAPVPEWFWIRLCDSHESLRRIIRGFQRIQNEGGQ